MTYHSGIIAKCHYARPHGVDPLFKSRILTCATLDSASSTIQCNLCCARSQIQSPVTPTPSLHPSPVGVAVSLVTAFIYQYGTTLDSASSTIQCNLYCARCQIQSPVPPSPSLHPPPCRCGSVASYRFHIPIWRSHHLQL